ncbi:MAG: hypothetical protein A3K09_06765 [Nitrospinae bacterium RIFCSPLOWO2_12_FULL_47_7]|nr:MAG: hypothetical protein A3K09_06765 [Nitrospinae bacterium RIFCSPLOWO2_12_FULL_47_7]
MQYDKKILVVLTKPQSGIIFALFSKEASILVDRITAGVANDYLLRHIEKSRNGAGASLAKIASGNRLSSIGEDPAAGAIAEQLRSEVAALSQSVRNVEVGANFINTAESGLSGISDLINRGRELALQSANGVLNDSQRQSLNQEFSSVRSEIDRITQTAQFNGQPLLNGNLGASSHNQMNIQAGSGSGSENQIALNVIESTSTQALGIDHADISTVQGAVQAVSALEAAAGAVSAARGQVGAIGNRLAITVRNLGNSIENLSSSESQLAGTDIAAEISKLQQSVAQTNLSIRALANQNQQNTQISGRILDIRG